MDTKGPGNTPIFTQAEFQAVSNTLADMKGRSAKDHVDLIQRLLAEKKVQLKDRIAAFEPDPPAPANPVPAAPPPSAPAAPPQGKQGQAAPAKTKDQPESLKEEFQRRVAGSEREKARVTQTAPVAAAVPPVPEMYSQEEDDGFEDDLPEGFMEAGEEAPAEAELDIF
jgi:hypothetical protein